MPGDRITVSQKETFWEAIRENASCRRAAHLAGFSEATGKRLLKKPSNGREVRAIREERTIPDTPVPLDEICAEAKAALADRTGFLFCKRYFGYEMSPFQMLVWEELEDAWDTEDREYLCLNGPPGLGKSTVFVMFAAKRVVLWRAIRIMFMSRADSLAVKNTGRLKRALERTGPAFGAAATLSGDFGRFKPRHGDVWKRNEYVVEQMDGEPIEEKESTVTAFGFEAEWLGNRIDLLFGDDLDSTRSIRNPETVEVNRDIYDGELEPRLGERGLLVIGQQRLGPTDFSAHVLAKMVMPDDDDGTGEDVIGEPMYRHVIYKVHYEDRCLGVETHRHDAPSYPEGCLLDPRRMAWRDVLKAMNRPDRFRVVYQQEEADPEGTLVREIWVEGGKDPLTGEDHPGCWDHQRDLCQLPRGLTGPLLSVVTVDPAAGKSRRASSWAFQWWVVHPESEQRFLMDCVKTRITADTLLDWLHDEKKFSGIMEDWQRRSERVSAELGLNVRITHWVLEAVGAFKFLQAYDHSKRWKRLNMVSFIAHETGINKHDTQLGVSSIRQHWRHGRVRLPGLPHGHGRLAARRLVEEVLRYRTDGAVVGPDDQVDANWMLEWNLPGLLVALQSDESPEWTPSWFGERAGSAA